MATVAEPSSKPRSALHVEVILALAKVICPVLMP
jgi:hypothetical protein